MKIRLAMVAAVALAAGVSVAAMGHGGGNVAVAAASGPDNGGYRVLAPVESGDLTLFPVVRSGGPNGDPFLTLDEGLRSGDVEVTEAGKVRGLVRPRGGVPAQAYRGDQVNTLVLVNHSEKPLLLLAGEIVTGGKQDRIVASDRIVPANSDPVDLSVFCIEHGRWTESSDKFGTTASAPAKSFMVQPQVRRQAMVAHDQQQVWDSVHGAIAGMARAAAPAAAGQSGVATTVTVTNAEPMPTYTADGASASAVTVSALPLRSLNTTSYAKAMQNGAVSAKVDQLAAPLMQDHEHVLDELRKEHAIGVVVAVHGEVIWADLFADTGLLTRYWTKLVRSYAAEQLTPVSYHGHAAGQGDAQRFLDLPMRGTSNSQGEAGVYRCEQAHAGGGSGQVEQITLESLLPQYTAEVHVARVKVRGQGEVLPVSALPR